MLPRGRMVPRQSGIGGVALPRTHATARMTTSNSHADARHGATVTADTVSRCSPLLFLLWLLSSLLQYRTSHFHNFLSGTTSILVCTDLASRGLDLSFVRHVIHFDFPLSVVDFLHRVGRTARNGAKGKSTALLKKRDKVLAAAIEVHTHTTATTAGERRRLKSWLIAFQHTAHQRFFLSLPPFFSV